MVVFQPSRASTLPRTNMVTISASWPRLSTIIDRLPAMPTRLVRKVSAITK